MSKGRLFGDEEKDIIEHLQNIDDSEICLPVESAEALSILNKIKDYWSKWVDNSKNTNNPPDFYCDDYGLMMDVMRVNDTERLSVKNKLYNPAMSHERDIYNKIEQSGLLTAAPNARVTIIGETELSTNNDHNFDFYFKNFLRVLKKHIESIPQYVHNHPKYKIIFVVFDESTAYFKINKPTNSYPTIGQQILGKPHLFFIDENFLNCFYNKGIDYLLWLTPYKLLKTPQGFFPLPQLTVYDLHKPRPSTINYDLNKMRSSEL